MRIVFPALLLAALAALTLTSSVAEAQTYSEPCYGRNSLHLGKCARLRMGIPLDRIPLHGDDRYAWKRSQVYTWHGQHRYTQWGMPVALVMPPTAGMTTEHGWGVTNTRIRRVDHQFYRDHLGPGQGHSGYRSTPYWPSDTTQFGVYPVRGPW